MTNLVLVILTKTYHSNIIHIHIRYDIETATIQISFLVPLAPSGAV